MQTAKESIEKQKEDFKTALASITDENGESTFSPERTEELASAVGERTKSIIAELEQYKTDYIALAKKIYKDGDTPTQEEIDKLNTLLDKIGEVRAKLNEAQDEAALIIKAKEGRILKGQGTEEDFGDVLGYVQQTAEYKAADLHSQNDSAIAALQTKVEGWQAIIDKGGLTGTEIMTLADNIKMAQDAINALFESDEQVDTTVFAEQQKKLQELFDGFAGGNPEAMAAIQDYAKIAEAYTKLVTSFETGEGLSLDEKKGLLTPENLKRFLNIDGTQEEITAALESTDESIISKVDMWLVSLEGKMKEELAGGGKEGGITDNPVAGWLKAMLESGSLDNLDVTKLQGGLKSAMTALDFIGEAKKEGAKWPTGLSAGMAEEAGNMSPDDFNTLRDKTLENVRIAFDSHSPARVMIPIGEDVTRGLFLGMADETVLQEIKTPADLLIEAVQKAFDLKPAGTTGMQAFIDGMDSKKGSAKTTAAGIAGAAKNATYLYSGFYAAGKSAISGFVAGMEAQRAAAVLAAQSIATAVLNAMKETLGIHSPSKEFAKLGSFSAEGYGEGFSGRMAQVERMISAKMNLKMENRANQNASPFPAPRAASGFSFVQNVYAPQTSYADQQREAVRRFRRAARELM